jgi:hypothetical protein
MFKYDGRNEKIKQAVTYANNPSLKRFVLDGIMNKASFDMSTANPAYIADEFAKFLDSVTITVETYRPAYRWSKAIGYFTPSKPTTIHFNEYKDFLHVSSIVGNFYHEATHMMDNFDLKHSYGHGSNSPTGKQNTAPYFIGNLAVSFMRMTESYNETESAQITYYVPWYKRLFNFFTWGA